MGEAKPCRCCLAQDPNKDMYATYFWMNEKENYANMLRECFNIVLSTSPYGYSICDRCVLELRAAHNFKNTVLHTEQELLKKSTDIGRRDKKLTEADTINVKVENLKAESIDSGDEIENYCLMDTEPEGTKVIIKLTPEPAKTLQKNKNKKVFSKKIDEKKNLQDKGVKRVLDKLKNIGNDELTIKKNKGKKGKQDKKPPEENSPETKPTTTYIINPESLKNAVASKSRPKKFIENFTNILECSNVVLFKDKSLLGYICGFCDSTFPDPQDLRTHKETAHKNEKYKFPNFVNLTRFTAKLDITGLKCTLCGDELNDLDALKDHLVKVHDKVIYPGLNNILQFKLKKGDVYDCAMCSATYETFKTLRQHMNKHYSNFSCTKCEATFTTKTSFDGHRRTHVIGNFKCEQCDKVFSSKYKLNCHEKSKHLGEKNIPNCPHCEETFQTYYQRNYHLVTVHNKEAQYKCNVCSKIFYLKTLLMYHVKKNHLMERNVQCSECGHRFFSKGALNKHMVKHTGAKKFSCDICLKPFARKSTLREHMRIHYDDRRFKCEICDISFVQKCSLKSHLLSNHGVSMVDN